MPHRAAPQATGPAASPHLARRLRCGPRDALPVNLAGLGTIEDLRSAGRARGWTALRVVPVLVGSQTAHALLAEAVAVAAPEAVTTERLLALPAWGRLDRLVVVGAPDGRAAARLADDLCQELEVPIRRGTAVVARALRVGV
jgi:hypothetical protein